jgi:lysyl-tRNA synthetase class 2
LNDPAEQRRRFEAQLTDRARGDLEAHAMDEDYIRALDAPAAHRGKGVGSTARDAADEQPVNS